jgi:flagellar assembly protein FliH
MSKHAKYLFDTTFDEDGSAPNPEVEAAFVRGHEAGLQAAQAQSEQMVAEAAVQIVERLSALENVRTELGARMSRQAITVAADLVRKMMPALVERGGMAEIEAVLEDALKRMLDEPRVVFRVPDAMLEIIQPRIAEMSGKANYSGEVVLLADNQMGLSDCLVEWADGGAERNVERLWSEVEEVLNRTLDTHPDGASPHISEDPPAPDVPMPDVPVPDVPVPDVPVPDFDAGQPGQPMDASSPGATDHQFTQPAPIADDPFNPGVSRDG